MISAEDFPVRNIAPIDRGLKLNDDIASNGS
jgi:hypothetical protein